MVLFPRKALSRKGIRVLEVGWESSSEMADWLSSMTASHTFLTLNVHVGERGTYGRPQEKAFQLTFA